MVARELRLLVSSPLLLCGFVCGVLCNLACSSDDAQRAVNGDGTGNGNNQDATDAWVFGTWSGSYKNKTVDADSSQRGSTIKATFTATADKKRQGDFLFEFPLLDAVSVKGSFTDFQQQSVMLKISESNFSPLGLAGSTTTLSYSLVGNDLEIFDERLSIKLIREAKSKPTDKDGGSGSLLGRWQCTDKNGRQWQLNIKNDKAFALDIYEAGKTSLWNDGSIALQAADAPYQAVLTVVNSKAGSMVGAVIKLKTNGDRALDLSLMNQGKPDDDSAIIDKFPCAKTE